MSCSKANLWIYAKKKAFRVKPQQLNYLGARTFSTASTHYSNGPMTSLKNLSIGYTIFHLVNHNHFQEALKTVLIFFRTITSSNQWFYLQKSDNSPTLLIKIPKIIVNCLYLIFFLLKYTIFHPLWIRFLRLRKLNAVVIHPFTYVLPLKFYV